MAACNMNSGRLVSRERQEVRTEYPSPGVQVHTFHCEDRRTEAERQADKEARLASFVNFRPSARCFI